MATDDPDIRYAYERAEAAGMAFTIGETDLGPKVHPCSARLILEAPTGDTIQLTGTSIGGGNVAITEVNGYQVRLSGEFPTLVTVHADTPGVILQVTRILAEHGINVAFMNVARQQKGRDAFMTIEGDHPIPEAALAAIAELPEMKMVRYLPKLA
ncbi:L-serine dehydratase, beta chain [compost metagenome]